MGNSKKTSIKNLSEHYNNQPVFHVQVKADYTPAKNQKRTMGNIARERNQKNAKLTENNGNEYRFFDADWNEYPANYDFKGDLPEGFIRLKWNKRLGKYVENKIYS